MNTNLIKKIDNILSKLDSQAEIWEKIDAYKETLAELKIDTISQNNILKLTELAQTIENIDNKIESEIISPFTISEKVNTGDFLDETFTDILPVPVLVPSIFSKPYNTVVPVSGSTVDELKRVNLKNVLHLLAENIIEKWDTSFYVYIESQNSLDILTKPQILAIKQSIWDDFFIKGNKLQKLNKEILKNIIPDELRDRLDLNNKAKFTRNTAKITYIDEIILLFNKFGIDDTMLVALLNLYKMIKIASPADVNLLTNSSDAKYIDPISIRSFTEDIFKEFIRSFPTIFKQFSRRQIVNFPKEFLNLYLDLGITELNEIELKKISIAEWDLLFKVSGDISHFDILSRYIPNLKNSLDMILYSTILNLRDISNIITELAKLSPIDQKKVIQLLNHDIFSESIMEDGSFIDFIYTTHGLKIFNSEQILLLLKNNNTWIYIDGRKLFGDFNPDEFNLIKIKDWDTIEAKNVNIKKNILITNLASDKKFNILRLKGYTIDSIKVMALKNANTYDDYKEKIIAFYSSNGCFLSEDQKNDINMENLFKAFQSIDEKKLDRPDPAYKSLNDFLERKFTDVAGKTAGEKIIRSFLYYSYDNSKSSEFELIGEMLDYIKATTSYVPLSVKNKIPTNEYKNIYKIYMDLMGLDDEDKIYKHCLNSDIIHTFIGPIVLNGSRNPIDIINSFSTKKEYEMIDSESMKKVLDKDAVAFMNLLKSPYLDSFGIKSQIYANINKIDKNSIKKLDKTQLEDILSYSKIPVVENTYLSKNERINQLNIRKKQYIVDMETDRVTKNKYIGNKDITVDIKEVDIPHEIIGSSFISFDNAAIEIKYDNDLKYQVFNYSELFFTDDNVVLSEYFNIYQNFVSIDEKEDITKFCNKIMCTEKSKYPDFSKYRYYANFINGDTPQGEKEINDLKESVIELSKDSSGSSAGSKSGKLLQFTKKFDDVLLIPNKIIETGPGSMSSPLIFNEYILKYLSICGAAKCIYFFYNERTDTYLLCGLFNINTMIENMVKYYPKVSPGPTLQNLEKLETFYRDVSENDAEYEMVISHFLYQKRSIVSNFIMQSNVLEFKEPGLGYNRGFMAFMDSAVIDLQEYSKEISKLPNNILKYKTIRKIITHLLFIIIEFYNNGFMYIDLKLQNIMIFMNPVTKKLYIKFIDYGSIIPSNLKMSDFYTNIFIQNSKANFAWTFNSKLLPDFHKINENFLNISTHKKFLYDLNQDGSIIPDYDDLNPANPIHEKYKIQYNSFAASYKMNIMYFIINLIIYYTTGSDFEGNYNSKPPNKINPVDIYNKIDDIYYINDITGNPIESHINTFLKHFVDYLINVESTFDDTDAEIKRFIDDIDVKFNSFIDYFGLDSQNISNQDDIYILNPNSLSNKLLNKLNYLEKFGYCTKDATDKILNLYDTNFLQTLREGPNPTDIETYYKNTDNYKKYLKIFKRNFIDGKIKIAFSNIIKSSFRTISIINMEIYDIPLNNIKFGNEIDDKRNSINALVNNSIRKIYFNVIIDDITYETLIYDGLAWTPSTTMGINALLIGRPKPDYTIVNNDILTNLLSNHDLLNDIDECIEMIKKSKFNIAQNVKIYMYVSHTKLLSLISALRSNYKRLSIREKAKLYYVDFHFYIAGLTNDIKSLYPADLDIQSDVKNIINKLYFQTDESFRLIQGGNNIHKKSKKIKKRDMINDNLFIGGGALMCGMLSNNNFIITMLIVTIIILMMYFIYILSDLDFVDNNLSNDSC